MADRQHVLKQSIQEIRRLRAELDTAERARTEPIAIIGMACRMPGGAMNPEQFWEFLRAGGDGTSDIPASRFDVTALYGSGPGARRGAFLDDIDRFDARFFGISPREAASLDPQQRLLLEASWEALEDAGIAPDTLVGSPTGVFFGITNRDYSEVQLTGVAPADLDAYYATSNAGTFGAGRLAYTLGLSGPALSVDTACSSSLVGVHVAAQSLRAGDCAMALAGGVNVLLTPEGFLVLSRTNALAPDGRCKTFDRSANGYVRGEGCAVIVLKRLSDARAAGDRILAVIRGSAVNQDGRSSGITVPNPAAQQAVVRQALAFAGVTPDQIDYVEAHGTGTPLGDPIELRALDTVLRAERPLLVGSVKTNIGHLEPAAGIAGLVKVVLSLRHGEIPPHRNLTEINPEIGIDELNIQIPTEPTAWPRNGRPRLAGVSSFGASGTNAHVIIEEAPEPAAATESIRPTHVLALSARTETALTELAARYRDRLADDTELTDICRTAATGRTRFPHRMAVVGDTAAELREGLADAGHGVTRPDTRPGVVFLFTGQGAQYPGMAGELYDTEPTFRQHIDAAGEILGRSMPDVLNDADLIHQTRYTQPALFAVEYALAQLWRSWGVEPVALLGHSIGELVAACVAGVLPFADGLRLAATRGTLMHELCAPGEMAAVFAPESVVREALRPFAGRLSIGAVNGPESVVVSGEGDALTEFLTAGLRAKRMTVTRAFHSPLVEPMLAEFERVAGEITFAPPRIPLISNVTGRPAEPFTAAYLREHVRQPVRFHDGMTTLFDQGHRIFLEIGPAPTLLGMAKRFAPAGDATFLPSLRPRHSDWRVLMGSVAELFTAGVDVHWTEPGRRVSLPTYPFQRDRHWFRPSARRTVIAGSRTLLGRRVPSPLPQVQFASRLDAAEHACLGDCVLDDLPVVNVGVYLETAFEAIGAGPLVIEDCLVLRGMVLDDPRNVQLVLDPDTGTFGYHSEQDDGWVQHCRGRIRRDPDLAPEPHDLPNLAGMTELAGSDFYDQLTRRKLSIGPAARWIDQIWRGSGEAVARMRPPAGGEADPYQLHPGFTDAMFQLLFACLPENSPPDAVYALVGIDRFVLHEHDRDKPLFCHARLDPGINTETTLLADVRLVDADGRTVVEATGVSAKRAVRDTVLRSSASSSATTTRPAATMARQSTPDSVMDVLLRTVAKSLRTSASDLDVHEPLQNLGLDSLMALEVKDALTAELGIALPLVAFLDGSSIGKLAELVSVPKDTDLSSAVDSAELPMIVPDPDARHETFPLTDLQQAYLVGRFNAFALGNVSTYFFIEVDLDGLDLPRLAAAFNRLIARHDMLRAVVTPDGYQRVLADVPEYPITVLDLRDRADADAVLAMTHDEMKHQVLDAATWPMFDIRASRLTDRRIRLHMGMDALMMDAWSTSLLFREWAELYRDATTSLPDLPVTYRDYVLAVRSMEGGPLYQRSLDYWRSRIATLPAAPDLPVAVNPATLARPEFTHRSSRLDEATWSRFKQHAAAAGVTPSAALCTAYAQVLAAWSGSSRFTLNVLFFNRMPLHPDVGNVVGNFTSTTLLEVDSSPVHRFHDRADRVQKQLWTDLEHSHVSGVQVLRELNRARGNATPMIMPVVFASTVNFAAKENSSTNGIAQHLLTMTEAGEQVWNSIRTPQVWLDHQLVEDGGALVVNWDSVDEIFPDGMIDAMFAAYVRVLTELCTDEQAWQRPAPLLVPPAQLSARDRLNDSAGPEPKGLLHDGFLARAAAGPDRPAVIAPDRTLTYGELDRVANQIGHWLRSQDVGPGALVAIVMEKGWEQLAAALAILKSGAAYVPIDVAVPTERLRLLLDNAGISVALTQSRMRSRTQWPPDTTVLAVDDPLDTSDEPLTSNAGPGDLAYVIYTSGSTGVPKGVMIEHHAALNTIHDVNDRFGVTSADRVLALSALNFDLSVYDVFGLLTAGGAVVVPEPGAHREPARWAELVDTHGVTVWNTVPTLMAMFTEHLLATGKRANLRVVMMSGDWIPVTLPDQIRRIAPGADIWSLGGATEASIWSIWYPIGRVDPAWPSIPYGVPMRNQRWHVLDEAMRPCPVWVPGALHIAGVGLARGYLNDEAKTAASFIRHPDTGERLYRTGDLGRCLPDGTIEFLGRADFQVKVQGYRVELGEIEATMLRCPGVRNAVVAALGAPQGPKHLVGYAVLDGPSEGAEIDITKALRQELPEYLVPQRIVILDELPLSPNGKVDRAALPAPDERRGDAAVHIGPRDDTERGLAEIFGEYFETDSVSVTASFFDLGGNSLMAVRLMAQIQQRLGQSLPVSTLFTHPTIELLARAIRDNTVDTRRTALVPIRSEGTEPPLVLVHPVGGDVLCYAELATLLDVPVYGLQVPDTDDDLTTIPAIAAHYVHALTEAFAGPYRIGGWSMGGVIALEMAAQLTEAGHQVDIVTAIDLLEPPGPSPDRNADDAELLAWFARDLAGLAEQPWAPTPDDFRTTDGRTPLAVLHDEARAASVLPNDIDVDALARIVERFARNARALLTHRPRTYAGPVRLLRAEHGASERTTARWLALLDNGVATDVPGDHYSAMRTPHLPVLATKLNAIQH